MDDSERKPRSPGRIRTWQAATLGCLVGVVVMVPVLLTSDADPTPTTLTASTDLRASAETTEGHTTTTVAPSVDQRGPVVEPTDLDASETSFGTLRWTRISGDADSVPAAAIRQAPDGKYVATEGTQRWESSDGLTWTHASVGGLEDIPDIWIDEEWARAESSAVAGTTGPPRMVRLFQPDDAGWTEVELPTPPLPEIDGIVWSVALFTPVEKLGTTIIHARAYGEIPWGDHYGVSSFPCGANTCESGPHGWIDQGDLWTIVPPSGGFPIATVAMTVTSDSIEFVDTETEELVHVIKANGSMSAGDIADKLADYTMSVTGVFVTGEDGLFEFHETPFKAEFGHVFAVRDGGFAALEVQGQELGSIQATTWTSDDAIIWTNRGTPPLLDTTAEWIHIDHHDDKIVANVILDSGSASGEETFETFETTDGLDWMAIEPSPFPLFTEFHDTSFGRVATAHPQSRYRFWLSADSESWEEVEGPPGPHEPNGAGMTSAGATGDILWLVVSDDSGSRTLWIGTFDG